MPCAYFAHARNPSGAGPWRDHRVLVERPAKLHTVNLTILLLRVVVDVHVVPLSGVIDPRQKSGPSSSLACFFEAMHDWKTLTFPVDEADFDLSSQG